MMFDPNSQSQHHQSNEQQQHLHQNQHQVAVQEAGDKSTLPGFPFCYNASMLQKGQQTPSVIESNCSDKSLYRFDVTQPFTYNYALVNQMSLVAASSNPAVTCKCDICGLVFGHLSLLNHHKRIHMADVVTDELFTCEICNTSFNQVCELKIHKETSHVKVSADSSSDRIIKKKAKFSKCENCDSSSERATSLGNLQEHSTDTDSNSEVRSKGSFLAKKKKLATVTKCEKCSGTGIIFVGSLHPVINKPFRCNICDGTFSRYSSLWSHRKLHSGEKPFKCDYCGVGFARAAYLKNHTRVHTGERPYKCDVCGMQFSQAPHLKSHERIHSGERPYECDICNKTFARHSTLWNHRRIHTGEKPYECEICGTSFNQASHLKNHAKVHTGEKPHRCDVCDVGFSDRFALKRHRAIHEKYGQTSRGQVSRSPVSLLSSHPWKLNQIQVPTVQLDSLYKMDQISRQNLSFSPSCSRPQDK